MTTFCLCFGIGMPWNVLGFQAYGISDGCYYYLSNMSSFLKKKEIRLILTCLCIPFQPGATPFIRISLKPNLFSPFLLFPLSWLLLSVVIHIRINVSLSILSFHNLSPRLKHGKCEGCWSQCSDFPTSTHRIYTQMSFSPICPHSSSLQLIISSLEYHMSCTDICHIQSFILLMSHNTKQFRHPIRFLSTLFLPAVCHPKN